MFLPDKNLVGCEKCMMEFKNCRLRKNDLLHYNQSRDRAKNQQLPANELRRGPITYFSINYSHHKNFYNFFEESVVNDFIESVYMRFVCTAQAKSKGMLK